MSLYQRVIDAVTGGRRKNVVQQEASNYITVNALCSAYENLFAQVRPLIDEMKMVRPYGVGRNGAKLPDTRTPELVVLQDPNEEMGWYEFADAMFATWLTESELNIHVHKDGRGRIHGYTILPPNCRMRRAGGEVIFQTQSAEGEIQTLTTNEVATLRFSRSPRNLDKGVSPASSVFTWSQIDDLMAQYQKAYLENGAIPASITIIRASTREKFDKAREELERQYSGAGNRNKTLYLWRQFNNDDGTERDQVEVKTIQGNNSTLAIKEIIDVINDRLNKAVGVSNFILGDDSSAKYDNAELSDLQFTKRRVAPALRSFWGQFQHEMDRIMGGLGYSISFDLDIPELTDRLKTKAETAEKNATTLLTLIQAGATPKAAVEAMGLGEAWLGTARGIYHQVLAADTSSIDKTNTRDKQVPYVEELNLVCKDKHSEKYSQLVAAKTQDAANGATGYPIFSEAEVREKQIYDQLMRIAEAMAEEYDTPIDEVVAAISDVLTGEAGDGANAGAEAVAELSGIGGEVSEEIREELNKNGFKVDEAFQRDLDERVDALVKKYEQFGGEKVREILSAASEEALSAKEIQKRLKQVLPQEMSRRAEMIARNETVHAFRAGRLANDRYLSERFGLKLGKEWKIVDGTACPLCQALDGEIVELSEPFPEHTHYTSEDGEEIEVHFEHSRWNDNGETPDAHVNCRCYFNEVVL